MKDQYEALCRQFRWDILSKFNIGSGVFNSKDDTVVAILTVHEDFSFTRYTFGELPIKSAQLANGLQALGISHGDRVGVFLAQSTTEQTRL